MGGNFARMSGAEMALGLAGAIARFEERCGEAAVSARSELTSTLDFLQERLNWWQTELARRREAFEACMAIVAEDGSRPDCSPLAAAVNEARAKADALIIIISRVEQAGNAYETAAARCQSEIASSCAGARTELQRVSRTIGWFEG